MKSIQYIIAVVLIFCVSTSISGNSPGQLNIPTPGDNEIPVSVYPSSGETVLVWISSEAGPQTAEVEFAQRLSQSGTEVWMSNLFEAHFLPTAQSSMDRVPATDVASLIQSAYEHTRKSVYIVTSERGIIPALRGIHHWQSTHPGLNFFHGLIVISPKVFVEAPDAGGQARFMPIVLSSNLPVYIMQPELSPWHWRLKDIVSALSGGGSDVFVYRLQGMRDRFYFRPDATDKEKAIRQRLPALLQQAVRLLKSLPDKSRTATPFPDSYNNRLPVSPGRKAHSLKRYQGDPTPPPLKLKSTGGKVYNLADYRGKVVLVNFWASWCPPCLAEMPSMERLNKLMADKPFTILAVNMAENKEVIRHFLQTKIKVHFTILLDSDGTALRRWKVFAFPTSFVIGPDGRIRYGLVGATEWDSPGIVKKLNALLPLN